MTTVVEVIDYGVEVTVVDSGISVEVSNPTISVDVVSGITTLSAALDVSTTALTVGDYLQWNGTKWVNTTAAGGATQLNELSDVNTSTPTNRNVLVADGIDWESRALVEADISDLQAYITDITGENIGSLADVTITTVADGELLVYSAGDWINRTLAEAGIATAAALTAHTGDSTIHYTQAAISITESQISDLQAYLTNITGEPISDLSDVTVTAVAAGELLKWSGTQWINNTLAEAGIASAADLTAHTGDSTIHYTQATISITESQISDLQAYLLNITGEPLSDLNDVTITTIATGEILKWSGTAWINNTLAEAGISATGHTHVMADITDSTWISDITAESIGDLSDVSITAAAKGDILVHNGTSWIDLTVGADTQVLTADSAEVSGVKWATSGSGATTFLALNDTPASYAGAGSWFVKVNAGATALEFVADPGYLQNVVEDTTPELGGILNAGGFAIQNLDQIRSDVVDGATAIALEVDTANLLSTAGAKLLSLKNNGTETIFFDDAGGFDCPSSCVIGRQPAGTIDQLKTLKIYDQWDTTASNSYMGIDVNLGLTGAATGNRSNLYANNFWAYSAQTGAADTGFIAGIYGLTLGGGGPNRFGSQFGLLGSINCLSNDTLNGYGLNISNPLFSSGTIENCYGLYVNNQVAITTGGTLSVGLYIHGRSGATTNTGILVNGDGLGSDIMFGAGQDANIYYDGTDLIINPKVVGTGVVSISGDLTATNINGVAITALGSATQFLAGDGTYQTLLMSDIPAATWISDLLEDTTPQLGGTLDCNSNHIDNAKTVTFIAENAVGIGTAINWTTAQKQSVAPSGATTYTFTAPNGPANLTLKITNGSANNPTWPATVKWAGGTEPTWSTGTDIASFYYDGTNYYGAANTGFA